MSKAVKRRRLSATGNVEEIKFSETEAEKPASNPEASPQHKDMQRHRTLFVRSIPTSVTSERLAEFFSESHPLKHATVVVDPQTRTSRGYGFVTFADPEDAQAVLAELNGANLDGRKIKVEIAEPRHREVPEEGGKSKPSGEAGVLKAEREKKRKAEETLPPKLIVRNLPWSVKEPEDLAVHFRSYGKVRHAIVPTRSAKVQTGFGFVVLRGRKNAEKAIQGVNGKVVDGRPLAVDWAVDKETWEKLQQEELKGEGGGGSDTNGDETEAGQATSGSSADINHSESASEKGKEEETSSSKDEVVVPSKLDTGDEEIEEDESKEDTEDDTEEAPSSTIFIRNLPFTSTDEILNSHFSRFGPVRYARVVFDHETERSRGTGFVCFFNEDDAKSCVKNAPNSSSSLPATSDKKVKGETLAHSVLQNEATDPTGQYTLEGRVLQISKALSKSDAARREAEGSSKREVRDHDKRRLYLLSEGTIPRGSKLYEQLGPAEMNIREASAKQRQKLIKSNPSLHLSLTRLSIRNIPRNLTSTDLKALAREAVVGFATDVKNGLRQPLSREELARSAESMKEAERLRKLQGKGIVKQAKIVFEGREGAKVDEKSGAGRSRGYGFVEYTSHRSALMGLRWLNGHAVKSAGGERSKRLIVEFAIENAQVVSRRRDREENLRTRAPRKTEHEIRPSWPQDRAAGQKRRRDDGSDKKKEDSVSLPIGSDEKNNLAKRNRIIAKKRSMRKSRKG